MFVCRLQRVERMKRALACTRPRLLLLYTIGKKRLGDVHLYFEVLP